MEQQLLNRLNVETSRVFSFDIFDTVLARAVTPPEAVFLMVGRRADGILPSNISPEEFQFHRVQADKRAKAWRGDRKTIEDIYSELQSSLQTSQENIGHLMEIELAVEKEVLYPVPAICEAIRGIRDGGGLIVFTSDMYLPSAFLKQVLAKKNIWQDGDTIIVSCEHGMLKSGGHLFRPMLEAVNGKASTTTHVGNCKYADVKGARQAGLRSVHFQEGNLTRYEEVLGQFAPQTRNLTGLFAGASQYARLETSVTSGRERAIRDVTAGVMAPVLTGFVLWILRQSQKSTLDRLYFTSRDGYFLVPLARKLVDALGLSCKVRYLFLSRAALAQANPDPEVLHRTMEFETGSGQAVLARFGIDIDDIPRDTLADEERKQLQTAPLGTHSRKMVAALIADIGSRSSIDSAFRQQRQLLSDYLRQEGLAGATEAGFVDLGWKGTVHSQLSNVLMGEGMVRQPIQGFFFGLVSNQQRHSSYRQAYFFDEYRGTGVKNALAPGSAIYTLMETFCTAPHGTVSGYEKTEGTVEATLEPSWADRMNAWGLPVVERTLHAFGEGLMQQPGLLNQRVDTRAASAALMRTFWESPTREEAAAWGDFPREIGQANEQHVEPLAPSYQWPAVFQFARYGSEAPKEILHRFSWPQGSFTRSPASLQSTISFALRARRFLKRKLKR